ncbi:polysaccharide biosynthesis tyrosine autokinase [Dyadobacter sp. NIV53]|uniref:GumC family protein n=1 Tax=Dyadobacter sp. NIV53 TaxID=2861765 RepID=UPI001C87B529|nr:polysaccharide biosynthesis tyrosine autokinase [Dyadobacter sp. NIV53]
MSQVISDLELEINYEKVDGLSAFDLYKSGPVKMTIIRATGNYENSKIRLVIKDRNSFLMEMPDGNMKTFLFRNTLTNSFGAWKLEPTSYVDQYLGSEMMITIFDPGKLAIAYQKRIVAELPNKLSTTVILSIKDQVAQRGIDILRRLMYNYNLASATAKNKETESTLQFIDERLAMLTRDLNDAEKGIETFKSSRKLTDISSDARVSLENMQVSDNQLNEINVKLSIIEGIEKYINSSQNINKAPATLGVEDTALNSLIEKLASLELQRERLLATTPETNPDFEPINRQIASTRLAIRENVANIKTSLQNTRDKLQSINQRFESSIKNIPVQERQYISIKRQQAIKESLFTYLLQKREEISVSNATQMDSDRIIDPPYAIQPRNIYKYLAIAAALLLGFIAPVGLIFTRNLISSKITDLNEIEDTSGIPVIGELPYHALKDSVTVRDSHATVIGEQFRTLRISLNYLLENVERGRVMLITSGLPGEGKSFVSSNLGFTLALSSRRTIILELDMRKPKMAGILNRSNEHMGVSEFLNGKANIEDIIQHSETTEKPDFISSGAMVRNPSELLERTLLKELIQNLRKLYDHIIIDSPPVHLVPDAMILSHLADVTLYVIRQGLTEKSELNFLGKLSSNKKLSNIQIIFNGVHWKKYGYGYNYEHTYYTETKNETIFSNFWSRF